jgi:5-methylcytosine-specific restriction endonuclease McrA
MPENREFNSGLWTKARFTSFIKSALRSASARWPPKYETLGEACVGKQVNKLTGRQANHFKCRCCGGLFPQKGVQVDHIKPIINPETGFSGWDSFIDNLFCEKEGLQVLCLACHNDKTNLEKQTRKINGK